MAKSTAPLANDKMLTTKFRVWLQDPNIPRLDIEASIPRLAGGLWGADLSAADLRDQVFLDLDRRSRNSKLIAFVRFRIATQRARSSVGGVAVRWRTTVMVLPPEPAPVR